MFPTSEGSVALLPAATDRGCHSKNFVFDDVCSFETNQVMELQAKLRICLTTCVQPTLFTRFCKHHESTGAEMLSEH